MYRKLLLAPTPAYPREQYQSLSRDIDLPKKYMDALSKAWDHIDLKLHSMDWKIDKLYALGGRETEDMLKNIDNGVRDGWVTSLVARRMLDNGARLVRVGDPMDYLEALLWDRDFQMGKIDYDFWSSVYRDLGGKIAPYIERDLKENETGFMNDGVKVIDNIDAEYLRKKGVEVEIVDYLGIYRNPRSMEKLESLMS